MAKHNPIPQPKRPDPIYRFRGHMSPQDAERAGIRAEVTATKDGDTATIRLYDVIDSWGGFWGISANEIIDALDELGDVKNVQVRINSPGGDAFEGIAIYNALASHPAEVNIVVDSLAASAASIVAMAGDTIEMMTGSQMMIHDASGFCIGNADDMTKMSEMLNHASDNLASVYAERAGGSQASWRAAMKEETWYSAQEAVDAGLATKVVKNTKKSNGDSTKAQFDLSVFNFAGRDHAPAPSLDTKNRKLRASVADSSKQGQENNRMTPEQLQAIGLAEDATDEQIDARLEELVKNETPAPDDDDKKTDEPTGDDADPSKTDEGGSGSQDKGDDAATGEPQASLQVPEGTVLVDKAQWQAVQDSMAVLNKMQADAALKERDDYIVAAMQAGKFPPAQRKHYENLWDSNAKETKALIDSLEPNKVPVAAIGHGVDNTEVKDDAFPLSMLRGASKKAGARR